MKLLVADDDVVMRTLLVRLLRKWGHEVEEARDGTSAWAALTRVEAPPALAILDWVMPGADGPTLCQRLREAKPDERPYVIVLTARAESADVVAALDAGADDHVAKPFEANELRARLRAAERTIDLKRRLAERVRELESALARVKKLEGILPICSYCKSVRSAPDAWRQIESYVQDHSDARFSHGICPGCFETHVAPEIDRCRSSSAPDPC